MEDQTEILKHEYNRWLRRQSWSWFATLKITSGIPSERRAKEFFDRWISDLRRSEGSKTFRWFRVLEHGGSGYDLLTRPPLLAVQIPRNKAVNRKKRKPYLTPEEFERLVDFVDEPYAPMIFVAVFSGLRLSELVGLKWEDVHDEALTVDERYFRGDWSVTKTTGSSATIGVAASVVARIHRLKTLNVEINWGGKGARKRFKLVRKDGPQDLVFQSLRTGAPMRDGNILRRHLRPAATKLGIDPKKATWRSLRTSCATRMIEAGANPKDGQGQMRHSRITTRMDIYAQHVPDSQRRAVARMMDMVESRRAQTATIN
jgi:integrase